MVKVALYSPSPKLHHLLAPALGPEYKLISLPDSERCKQMMFDGEVDVLLLDLESEPSNVEAQVELFEEFSATEIPIIILADDASRQVALDLVTRDAFGYCRKPPALRELKPLISRAHQHAAMRRELKGIRRGSLEQMESARPTGCDGLIGSSPEMQRVYDLIRRVASLNASVLITGESGTGKELVARAIHNMGSRANAPFVAVSVGAMPESLVESELFGHEKGAFTGTAGTRIGYFEQAGNGTILIDEIGELSAQTQVKLLRVLQQKEFKRLGSGRSIPLRARVLFATHRDLSTMVTEGSFRLDLFYRINVVGIRVPSLQDHAEDIPSLVDLFVRRYSEVFEKRIAGIAPDALAMLQGYDWPGNVRELENVIQSSLIHADGDMIEPCDLPEQFQQMPRQFAEFDGLQAQSFEKLLREFKFRLASKAIENCSGNKTLAARSLDISRAYLHRLLRAQDDADVA